MLLAAAWGGGGGSGGGGSSGGAGALNLDREKGGIHAAGRRVGNRLYFGQLVRPPDNLAFYWLSD